VGHRLDFPRSLTRVRVRAEKRRSRSASSPPAQRVDLTGAGSGARPWPAIAGLVLAWAKALLRVLRLEERASMSVHTRAGARTKEAEFAVMNDQGSQLWMGRAEFPPIQSYHARPGSRGVLQVELKSMPHTKPRLQVRGQSAR
jgi:hypothetical protein